jgi:hypothetical protein
MWINFFKMNLFKAALTPELRSVVAQQEQETITIKRMYQVATTAQRELKGKGPALVNEIREEELSAEGENNDVAAFNRRGARPKTTNPADKHEETTTPDEEATKLDQDEEETQAKEAMTTGTANTATFARSKDIVK